MDAPSTACWLGWSEKGQIGLVCRIILVYGTGTICSRVHVHMTSARRGEGGWRYAQFCRRIVVIGCMKCGRGGGGESKIPKILRTSYVHGPLALVNHRQPRRARPRRLQYSAGVKCWAYFCQWNETSLLSLVTTLRCLLSFTASDYKSQQIKILSVTTKGYKGIQMLRLQRVDIIHHKSRQNNTKGNSYSYYTGIHEFV